MLSSRKVLKTFLIDNKISATAFFETGKAAIFKQQTIRWIKQNEEFDA